MSVGLYMDVHVPAAITRALVLRGVDVLTAQLEALPDSTIQDCSIVLLRSAESFSARIPICSPRQPAVNGAADVLVQSFMPINS